MNFVHHLLDDEPRTLVASAGTTRSAARRSPPADGVHCGSRSLVALVDGSRLDDCQLVSAGRHGGQSLWLYDNGADTFVTLMDVTDVWEARSSP